MLSVTSSLQETRRTGGCFTTAPQYPSESSSAGTREPPSVERRRTGSDDFQMKSLAVTVLLSEAFTEAETFGCRIFNQASQQRCMLIIQSRDISFDFSSPLCADLSVAQLCFFFPSRRSEDPEWRRGYGGQQRAPTTLTLINELP